MSNKKRRLTKEERDEAANHLQKESMQRIEQQIQVNIHPKTKNQKSFTESIRKNQITIGCGLAGTGKTILSVAESLKILKDPQNNINKIILVKSVTPLKDEEIGYLKGNIDDKMEPFMYSFMSNFYKIIGKKLSDMLLQNDMIEILPLAYIRGMSIDNSIIIADESQNISISNMKTLMTRLGTNTKLIIIGDSNQIDMKNKKMSSLEKVCEHFVNIEHIGILFFDSYDQQRNPLINLIEEIFDTKIEPR